MTCTQIQKKLSAFIDGASPAREAVEIRRHLADCADCRRAHERLQRLAMVLEAVDVPPAPVELEARIIARGCEHLAHHRLLRRLPRWESWAYLPGYMKAAASVVLLIGLGLGTWLGWQVSSQTSTQAVAQQAAASDDESVFGLDFFADLPDGSLAQAYFDLSAGGQ